MTECGNALRRNQYRIKILNTINFKKSHHYNPFAYSVSFGLEGAVTAVIIHVVVIGLIVWWGTRRKTVPTNVWATEI